MTRTRSLSRGLLGFAVRHRVAFAVVLIFLNASPGLPDDRQLLQANAGAKTDVLLILDSSTSMHDEFLDYYGLPAYMDDFIYPQGSSTTSYGSKFGIAKSVLREIISGTEGVNWAFASYRNPNPRFGSDELGVPAPDLLSTGAHTKGELLVSGGMEWLYFAKTLVGGANINTVFSPTMYPDLQSGRFLQLGHVVMRNYIREDLCNPTTVGSGTPTPTPALPGCAGVQNSPPWEVADVRPPWASYGGGHGPLSPPLVPQPGVWTGAFGPKGFDSLTGQSEGIVIYRNAAAPGHELHLRMVDGGVGQRQYGDPRIVIEVTEWAAPTASPTPSPTPTFTSTPTSTSTPTITSTPTASPTATSTVTPTVTSTFTKTNTPTITQTPTITLTVSQTSTQTKTQTPTITPTFTQSPTDTRTPTLTQTSTKTNTPTITLTFTKTNTPTITGTFTKTPTGTRTPTITLTPTKTRTATPTQTFTKTATNTVTQTFTKTPTDTFTPTATVTPTGTQTGTNTATATITQTFTVTPTFTITPTFTQTPTVTITPTNTATDTPTNTPTNTGTFTKTNTPTDSPTFTQTATNTPTPANTFTPTTTATKTPTKTRTPTLPHGSAPAASTLPVVANWFSASVRGLLAMAPPPPPPLPGVPCPGLATAPPPANTLLCAPCTDVFGPDDPRTDKICGYTDVVTGDPTQPDDRPFPVGYRGFDDPQADPDSTKTLVGVPQLIVYERGDLYDLGGNPGLYPFRDKANPVCPKGGVCVDNGNPPWGSVNTTQVLPGAHPASPFEDNDADGVKDLTPVPGGDRHNQGMYPAFDNFDRAAQQGVKDAFADASCSPSAACNPYTQDCGGLSLDTGLFPLATPSTAKRPPFYDPYPGGIPDPPGQEFWPMVPFPRDWQAGIDSDSKPAIKRLLRFASSIVRYDSGAGHMNEYTLAEDATSVLLTSNTTPIGAALHDAYNYFVNTVFQETDDPAINCRKYIIVFITDGLETCGVDLCANYPSHPFGPAGDLGAVALPSVGTARADAHAIDSSIPVHGVPVYVVAMIPDSASSVELQCVADHSSAPDGAPGHLYRATDRAGLKTALSSILELKRSAQFFAAPSVPSVGSGIGNDVAHIGAVIPSHQNPTPPVGDGSLSTWSVWSGSLKAFKLDTQHENVPVVTAGPPVPTNTPTAGGPTATPVIFTATPTATPLGGTAFYPDQSNPDAAKAFDNSATPPDRRPLWDAARLLGYTDPVTNLIGGQPASLTGSPNDPNFAIKVWPGRRMVWADSVGPTVPRVRRDLLPDSGPCAGWPGAGCFTDLMNLMGTGLLGSPLPTDPLRHDEAKATVQFLRGGTTDVPPVVVPPIPPSGDRDQVLNAWWQNLPSAPSQIVGPHPAELNRFSYFYQDDCPVPSVDVGTGTPGCNPPQLRTDYASSPPGYPHKLGDIFHSEPLQLDPPRYFQFLSSNLTPRTGAPGACGFLPDSSAADCSYGGFASQFSKRRKVIFVGANDGFLHAFDSGVWDRDDGGPYNDAFDLGTGQEIFAYAPRSVMNLKFPNLINFPPAPAYFVDGSMATADVFIDSRFAAAPADSNRFWRTVLVGSLRQGGVYYYALDVTQPDALKSLPSTDLRFGEQAGAKDASPSCLGDNSNPATPAGGCAVGSFPRLYPEVLWEMTDNCDVDASTCLGLPYMGETWSKPIVGRIQVITSSGCTGPVPCYQDRYVAIIGGGYDSTFKPGDTVQPVDLAGPPAVKATQGRSLYMIDVETGKVLYKASAGYDGANWTAGTSPILFAPMPASAAVVDYNDDGYLDLVYIGDVNGRMWRIDLAPGLLTDASAPGVLGAGGRLQPSLMKPLLLYDATTSATAPLQPIYMQAGIIFINGGSRPTLGVAFGTGDRADLTKNNTGGRKRIHFVVDNGQTPPVTFHETNLTDITPTGVTPTNNVFPLDAGCPAGSPCAGYFLNFAGNNEKATSTAFSTRGFIYVITFTPDTTNPCTTEGSSFRYSFFFLTGAGAYGTGHNSNYQDYQQGLGGGVASAAQTINSTNGETVDTVLFSGGSINQQNTPSTIRTNRENVKETNQ